MERYLQGLETEVNLVVGVQAWQIKEQAYKKARGKQQVSGKCEDCWGRSFRRQAMLLLLAPITQRSLGSSL